MPTYKITPHFEEAYRFIDDSLRKGNLLVHCAAGISRVTFSLSLVNNFCLGLFDEKSQHVLSTWVGICTVQKISCQPELWIPERAKEI